MLSTCGEMGWTVERVAGADPLASLPNVTTVTVSHRFARRFGVGFPESVLTSDERVVLHLHPHWKALIRPIFVLILAVAAVVAAAIFLPASWRPISLYAVGALALVAVAWLSFWPWMTWRTTHYVFTNERVILREGVFAREGRDIPLGRVNDVSFGHNVFERMLGCGTLTIESAGERGQVVLDDIPRVEKTQSVLYELVEADRAEHSFGDEDRDAIVREVRRGDDDTREERARR
jgi:uncharacterized membrane protein YdbT with pleckstrin-like domain